ncbi:MAG TPA: serine hydrolase domain-containing protein [Pirellulales bacterium]|jgi:CubicO group peptidase (beta-lactamase class C family)|nr:serine hydrolase domain-containing protein [Pirellulales bacterium]
MTRCNLCRATGSILAWLALVTVAHAAGDFVILGDGNAFWTNNTGAHISKQLIKLQKANTFHSVSFTPNGDWVVLTEGNGYYTSNLGLPGCKKLAELQKAKNTTFKCVAFAPSGGWTVLWNQNGNWTIGKIPDDAFKKIVEVSQGGGTLRSVSFGPNGAWVVLFGKTGVWYGSVPSDLAKVLDNAVKKNLAVRCVSFTTLGTWICLTNNGWWTNDLDHPACKMIQSLEQQHKQLRWVAVAPEIGPHDFSKWSDYLHKQCDGKLAGGYAFEVLQHGEVVAKGAEGWARAPWQPDHPSVKWTLDKPMGVASVSKTITAVALLKLWEVTGQKFSLDDPFWPHIKAVCPAASSDVKKVTIRQLLQHRSGFKKMSDFNTPADLEKLLTEPLAHPPGTHYAYDNNNFYIARLIIEQIGHVQYMPFVKAHVLKPMGITQMETHFQADAPTCGYKQLGSTRPGFPFDWNCDATAGAAGWYASVSDLGRFLTGLRDHKVLSRSTTDMMYHDLLGWDTSEPGWEKNGGWFWDEGSGPGSRAGSFRSSIFHFPDDVDAAMLINCDPPKDPEALLGEAWQISMQK